MIVFCVIPVANFLGLPLLADLEVVCGQEEGGVATAALVGVQENASSGFS